MNAGANFEIDVQHNLGYELQIRGALAQPNDQVAFVRKDKALDGVDADSDTSAGLASSDDAANCAQAIDGSLPTSQEGARTGQRDGRTTAA